jgi:asparagine synthase (glutamine-hydrolysing)
LLFRSNPQLAGADFLVLDPDTFAGFTGTFFFQGTFGRDALRKFLDSLDVDQPSLDGCQGQFCLVVRRHGTLFLFADSLGMNKLYCDEGQQVFSSLFLGVAETLSAPTIDVQGCYEYAWNGVSMGERTFYEQLRTLRSGTYAAIERDRLVTRPLRVPELREDENDLPAADLVDAHLTRCRSLFATYARNFGNRIHLSMSGGFDSRLLLALFLHVGVRPHLFCYANEEGDDEDAAIVRRVAEGEGLALELVDKSRARTLSPSEYADEFKRTCGAFDGWKVDGIFDTGADRADRADRVRNGRVKVNGSAGEIYRNFFYLRGRPLAARELVWSFFARYDPSWCTAAFISKEYERELALLVARDVGARNCILKRYQIELAYPLVRVRYWTARDVQLNQGFGMCLFPFLEPSLIKGTCDIPIREKSYGIFEGKMISVLNQRVAAYGSSYGFSLQRPAPLKYRLAVQGTYLRPPYVRRFAYRIRQRAARPKPYFLSRSYLSRVLDPGFPIMRRYFKVEAIRDIEVLNRVATMEFHCERHGVSEMKGAG